MKVLHINCNYVYSGLHQELINALNKTNIFNKVFVPLKIDSNAEVSSIDNVVATECFKTIDRFFFYYKQRKIFETIEKNITVSEYDCIHAHTLFTDGNCAYELSKLYEIPYIVAVRNTDVNFFFKYFLHLRKRGKEILKKSSAVIFLSESYKEYVLNRFLTKAERKIIEEKAYVLPNGINDYWHDNLYFNRKDSCNFERIKHKEIKVLYAGDICKNKNVDLTIKALDILKSKNWRIGFSVVGRITEKKYYEKIEQTSYLKYSDRLDKTKLIDYYRDSDLFIMPSHRETFGLVYAEAMSQGLPVIYTRGQGFDGQFDDGIVGYATSDYDEQELAEQIVKITNNYLQICNNCLHYVSRFKWDSIAEQYKQIYLKVVNKE